MAYFTDTYTGSSGTALSSHTSDSGGSWTNHPTFGGAGVLSNANRLRSDNSAGVCYISASSVSADYDVQFDLRPESVESYTGGAIRLSTSEGTMYEFGYDNSFGYWYVGRTLTGSYTELGNFTQTLSVGTVYTCRVEVRGSSVRAYVNNVLRINVSDSFITAAGRAGVSIGSVGTDTSGIHMDNFSASDPSGGMLLFQRPNPTILVS